MVHHPHASDREEACNHVKSLLGGAAGVAALPPDLLVNGDTEANLRRFLAARGWDAVRAHAMLTACVAWRKERNVASIFAHPLPLEKVKHLALHFPHAHHGFDKKGQPIYIDCTGRADVDKVLSLVTKEEVVHTHILLMEWQARVLMKAASEARGATVHHMLNVVDLHGCSLRLAARRSVDIFQAIAAVDQPNYPETMGATFVVNAPKIFTMVWRLVKVFLDEHTVAKVHILGAGEPTRTALLDAVDAAQLPSFLGGSCRCDGGCVSGPACTAPDGLVASQRALLTFLSSWPGGGEAALAAAVAAARPAADASAAAAHARGTPPASPRSAAAGGRSLSRASSLAAHIHAPAAGGAGHAALPSPHHNQPSHPSPPPTPRVLSRGGSSGAATPAHGFAGGWASARSSFDAPPSSSDEAQLPPQPQAALHRSAAPGAVAPAAAPATSLDAAGKGGGGGGGGGGGAFNGSSRANGGVEARAAAAAAGGATAGARAPSPPTRPGDGAGNEKRRGPLRRAAAALSPRRCFCGGGGADGEPPGPRDGAEARAGAAQSGGGDASDDDTFHDAVEHHHHHPDVAEEAGAAPKR